MPSVSRGALGHLAVAAVLVVAVLSFPSLAPNPYILSAGIVVLNYAVLSTSWNFVGGFTGYISLGHGALAGLGAYGTGLLVVKAGLPPFLALFAAALIVAALAVPIGYAALRVRGASFVIVSIALVLILLLVFQSWASFTGGSRGLNVPRPFPGLLRPEHHRVFFFLFGALLGLALLAWWAIDRSRFGLGLKAIREDEDKAEALGTPTFTYKLVVFVVSAWFTGLAGGLYALWFGDLDPVFQFSILTGSYMVLMALLGGVRNLYGPLLGALVIGIALEYFKVEFGNTPLHLVATGLLLGLVVMFMPDGVLPALGALANRFRPAQSSIREMTAAELRDEREGRAPADDDAGPDGGGDASGAGGGGESGPSRPPAPAPAGPPMSGSASASGSAAPAPRGAAGAAGSGDAAAGSGPPVSGSASASGSAAPAAAPANASAGAPVKEDRP